MPEAPATALETSPARNESLDWLRGILAVSVMLYHLVGWQVTPLDSGSLLGRLGIYAVSMFFVLSGLSIAMVYSRYIVDRTTTISFYVRRVFRIWPLFWVAVIGAAALQLARGVEVGWKLIALNLTTLFAFIRPTAYLSTGAWSIGNEMVYYALSPILLVAYRRSRILGNLLVLASIVVGVVFSHVLLDASAPLAQQWATYVNPFNNLFLYCCGIAIYFNASRLPMRGWMCWSLATAGLAVFLIYPADGNQIVLVTGTTRLVLAGASIAIVVAFYRYQGDAPQLLATPLTHLGLATYGVYLLHPVVHDALGLVVQRLDTALSGVWILALTTALTVVWSIASYHFYELPLIRLGKHLTSRPKAAAAGLAPAGQT